MHSQNILYDSSYISASLNTVVWPQGQSHFEFWMLLYILTWHHLHLVLFPMQFNKRRILRDRKKLKGNFKKHIDTYYMFIFPAEFKALMERLWNSSNHFSLKKWSQIINMFMLVQAIYFFLSLRKKLSTKALFITYLKLLFKYIYTYFRVRNKQSLKGKCSLIEHKIITFNIRIIRLHIIQFKKWVPKNGVQVFN